MFFAAFLSSWKMSRIEPNRELYKQFRVFRLPERKNLIFSLSLSLSIRISGCMMNQKFRPHSSRYTHCTVTECMVGPNLNNDKTLPVEFCDNTGGAEVLRIA
eukprot:990032_1